LIKFADQKVAAISVFIALEVTAVLEMIKNYDFTLNDTFCIRDTVFTIFFIQFLILFFISITVCLYYAITGVLKPIFQTETEKSDNLFFWENTEKRKETEFINAVNEIKDEEINVSISSYIFITSKRLRKKLDNCGRLATATFLSFIFMLIILIIILFSGIK